ncbi:MAG: DUF3656 domain-containing protein, partial [Planctomycetes bacterium]|nr:DUF3656 domain-containing protein [Planctomycetota bacterium]
YYRRKLDAILAAKGLRRSSSGTVRLGFEPNPEKTFNRGFTDYGLTGACGAIASHDTPKSVGEYLGKVTRVEEFAFVLDDSRDLRSADGICFFDRRRNLEGTVVNRVEGRHIYPQKMQGLYAGQEIYRNFDHAFTRRFAGRIAERKVRLTLRVQETAQSLILSGRDEDGNEAEVELAPERQPAQKKDAARQTLVTQLTRLGNTIFECPDVHLETGDVYFLPVSRLNAAKRELIERLLQVRQANRPRRAGTLHRNAVPFPQKHLSYLGNVLNAKAAAFYRRHGVETIAPAAEAGLDLSGRTVMTTKYCLQKELGWCSGSRSQPAAPLWLEDEDGHPFEVHFHCGPCGMEIFLGRKEQDT